ncbi:DUF1643 domain-containing protein [Pseudooceanicola sp. C21-150M6]|uniref:DUF1643 domain-containing protein n=1 Tax=Pseudooceanicola sp. C21-150M6 TaxID=3434355 RepID=UPI003D7FE393
MTQERRHLQDGTESRAVYSDCDTYRYDLARVWAPEGPRLCYVMLNPSTASETRNDPTVARCERRARALGYGGFRVVNIFAFRATDPKVLMQAADPVGPDGDAYLLRAADWADRVIAAWGVHGAHRGRGAEVAALLRQSGKPLFHLGLSRDGHPRHPLYIGYGVRPVAWASDGALTGAD